MSNAKPEARDQSGAVEPEPLSDPFAGDLFASHNAPADTPAWLPENPMGDSSTQAGAEVRWDSRLPRFSASQARLSWAMAAPSLSLNARALKACGRVLAARCNTSGDEVTLALIDVREEQLDHILREVEATPGLWASLAVEPDGSPLLAHLDSRFGASLIDLALGGDGSAPDSPRQLSRLERPVMEFIWLGVMQELNAELREPLFRWDRLTTEPPEWLGRSPVGHAPPPAQQATEAHAARALLVLLRVSIAGTIGLVRCVLTGGALAALDASGNPLLRRGHARKVHERIARLKSLIPEVTLCLMIGETDVEIKELAQLEEGDVLVIERDMVNLRDKRLAGRLRLRAGDGTSALIVGMMQGEAHEQGSVSENAKINLILETIQGGDVNPHATEQLKMKEEEREETAAGTEEGAALLDGLMLTVHVEMAARRIGLEELAHLRAGQILELDCRATDLVDLVAEGRHIARGELVDIEGRLGVRITQVMR